MTSYWLSYKQLFREGVHSKKIDFGPQEQTIFL